MANESLLVGIRVTGVMGEVTLVHLKRFSLSTFTWESASSLPVENMPPGVQQR